MDKEELKPLPDVFLATINGIEYLVARNSYRTRELTEQLRSDGDCLMVYYMN